MGSENPSGAENQQERLIRTGWVIGFVDGEGCFSIGFIRQPDRKGRSGYRAGYQVFHEFVVTQGAKSVSCLEELREFFGVGQVLINRRRDDHREHLHRYVVAATTCSGRLSLSSRRISCGLRRGRTSRHSRGASS